MLNRCGFRDEYCSSKMCRLTAERGTSPALNCCTKVLAVQHICSNTVTQCALVIFSHANIIDTISEVGGGINYIMTASEGTFRIGDDGTFCLKCSFFRIATFRAEVATAAIFTDNITHRHFPCCSKRPEVLCHVSIRQLELIVFVAIKIATQAAGFASVVSRYCDSDVIDQIICYPQAKVGHNDIISPLLINRHCTVEEFLWKVT